MTFQHVESKYEYGDAIGDSEGITLVENKKIHKNKNKSTPKDVYILDDYEKSVYLEENILNDTGKKSNVVSHSKKYKVVTEDHNNFSKGNGEVIILCTNLEDGIIKTKQKVIQN